MDSDNAALGLFAGFYQNGYVTNDLDRAIDVFASRYGVARFAVTRARPIELEGGAMLHLDMAMGFVGPVQYEILQPAGGADGIYRRALEGGGEGFKLRFHHHAYLVASPEDLLARRRCLEAGGHPIVLCGGRPGANQFFYADATATLGHHLEYLYICPERMSVHANMPRN
jgi:hypothetical protein